MKILLVLLLFGLHWCKIQVNPKTQFLTDSYNRSLHLHGMNAIYKMPPFYPNYTSFSPLNSLCEQDFQNLQKWGFNFLRLYAPWQGIESQKGQYNQTLINEIKKIVSLAEKYGVYILLDAHQDLGNRKFCGEGFPDWAVSNTENFPEPVAKPDQMGINKTTEYPNMTDCLSRGFSEYYPTYGVSTTFQNLYQNVGNLSDHFAGMWKTVAQNFQDQEIVIGYEILNEPWFGDIFKDPGLAVDADRKNLQPFYTKVAKAIREADNDTLIFFEPVVAEEVYIDMNDTPLGKDYHSKEVFSFHLYCGFQERNTAQIDTCDAMIDAHFNLSYNKGKQLGAGMFVTEFGAKEDTDDDMIQLNYTMSKCESKFLPWAYWQFKLYQDYTTQLTGASESVYFANGTLQENKLKALVRSYFYAICGTPVSTSFEAALLSASNGGTLHFSFYPSNCKPKNTEFYLSEDYYYKNGFTFNSDGCPGIKYQQLSTPKYYELIVPDSCLGKLVHITISPKTKQIK